MKCIVCGSEKNKIYKSISGINIFQCASCTLAFVNIKNFVPKDLSSQYEIADYKREELHIKDNFKKLIKRISVYKDKGKVLDIGSGFGLFALELSRRGKYDIEVLDPYLKPLYLKNSEYILHKKTLERFLSDSKKKYDLIILIDVLEHFINPVKNLQRIKSIMNDDAILIIQTPNYDSLMQYFVKNWSWWMIDDHKYFFTPNSLKLLLSKSGFHIVSFDTYEPYIDFKKNLDGNFSEINNKLLRKLAKLAFFSIFIPVYFLTRKFYWKLNKGALIFVIAQIEKKSLSSHK